MEKASNYSFVLRYETNRVFFLRLVNARAKVQLSQKCIDWLIDLDRRSRGGLELRVENRRNKRIEAAVYSCKNKRETEGEGEEAIHENKLTGTFFA